MAVYSQDPEILPPPNRSGKDVQSSGTLDVLTSLLDDAFAIPGTNIRFGLDPLIGLIPGFGDLITSCASLIVVLIAWQRGLPMPTITRMVVNIGIDTLVGALPLVGDVFDLAWKANRKNLSILQRNTTHRGGDKTWQDWLFLAAVLIAGAILLAVPLLSISWVGKFLWRL